MYDESRREIFKKSFDVHTTHRNFYCNGLIEIKTGIGSLNRSSQVLKETKKGKIKKFCNISSSSSSSSFSKDFSFYTSGNFRQVEVLNIDVRQCLCLTLLISQKNLQNNSSTSSYNFLSLTFAASFLESKMVCTPEDLRSSEATMSASGSLGRNSFEATEDSHSSGLLRTQDLQEAKDQIIVEVADTLGVPLYSAENLLSQNFWSREAVLEKWRAEQQAASTSQQPSQPLMDTTNSRSSEMQQQQSVAVASSSSTAGTTTKTFATPPRGRSLQNC